MRREQRAEWFMAIADEVENDPSRWTKGTSARDSKGVAVSSTSELAVCWCASGFIQRSRLDFDSGGQLLADLERAISPNKAVPYRNDHLTDSAHDFVMWFRAAARRLLRETQ